MNTKAFYIGGIVIFYFVISWFLSLMGVRYTDISQFNMASGSFAPLPTNVLGVGDILGTLLGIFNFHLAGLPIWLNFVLWLPLLIMIVLIYEEVRGN
jgi:hypothetical protein